MNWYLSELKTWTSRTGFTQVEDSRVHIQSHFKAGARMVNESSFDPQLTNCVHAATFGWTIMFLLLINQLSNVSFPLDLRPQYPTAMYLGGLPLQYTLKLFEHSYQTMGISCIGWLVFYFFNNRIWQAFFYFNLPAFLGLGSALRTIKQSKGASR